VSIKLVAASGCYILLFVASMKAKIQSCSHTGGGPRAGDLVFGLERNYILIFCDGQSPCCCCRWNNNNKFATAIVVVAYKR
jgi:hypothetical protein